MASLSLGPSPRGDPSRTGVRSRRRGLGTPTTTTATRPAAGQTPSATTRRTGWPARIWAAWPGAVSGQRPLTLSARGGRPSPRGRGNAGRRRAVIGGQRPPHPVRPWRTSLSRRGEGTRGAAPHRARKIATLGTLTICSEYGRARSLLVVRRCLFSEGAGEQGAPTQFLGNDIWSSHLLWNGGAAISALYTCCTALCHRWVGGNRHLLGQMVSRGGPPCPGERVVFRSSTARSRLGLARDPFPIVAGGASDHRCSGASDAGGKP